MKVLLSEQIIIVDKVLTILIILKKKNTCLVTRDLVCHLAFINLIINTIIQLFFSKIMLGLFTNTVQDIPKTHFFKGAPSNLRSSNVRHCLDKLFLQRCIGLDAQYTLAKLLPNVSLVARSLTMR